MAYKIRITEDEMESLDYIGERYEYARVLVDIAQQDDSDPELYHIDESDAWEFSEAVDAEDGDLPLLGGALADKVQALLDNIV